jgi:hypothetical protein
VARVDFAVAASPKLSRTFGKDICGFASIRGCTVRVVDLHAIYSPAFQLDLTEWLKTMLVWNAQDVPSSVRRYTNKQKTAALGHAPP